MLHCPVPLQKYPRVLVGHGGGGKLTQQLIRDLFLPSFNNDILAPLHDGASLSLGEERLAFTTDAYVVHPVEFPGGTIGDLAINGTINDLAMCGAQPLWIAASLIIEEGCALELLSRVIHAMAGAARRAGVNVVTGDTKVVERGKGDTLFVTTSGIGRIRDGVTIDPRSAQAGDIVLLSGTIGDHGMAIMSVREHLGFSSSITSDTSPLHGLVGAMLDASPRIHVLRDPTRGGVASALNEIASSSRVGIRLQEASLPVLPEVRHACELLGFDPLYVANEGKCLAVVPREDAERVLAAMKLDPAGAGAVMIGQVVNEHQGMVVMDTQIGGTRIVDMLSGEQLPRIC